MAANPEFMTVNLIDTATLSESSEESSLPAENIQSLHRTKVWRSDSGWNIVAGVNDKLDYDPSGGGEETATFDAGNYATGAAMATQITSKMPGSSGASYSTGTRKFTIVKGDEDSLDLLWNSGTNTATSIGEDIGFDTSVDDTGEMTYEGDDECRCSREWIGIDLAAATQCKRCAIVSHNFSSSATVTLYRHTADSLSAATSVGAITYDADFMVLTSDATYRYWWIHVDDIDNSDSYIEIGRAFLGDFDVLTTGLGGALTFGEIDPSAVTFTPEGAVGKNERTHYFQANINLRHMLAADRDDLLTIYGRVGAYEPFFVRLDPAETTFAQGRLGGMYAYFTSRGMNFDAHRARVLRYSSELGIEEAR